MNKRRISLREGQVFLDGVKIMDAANLEVNFSPDVVESRALKEKGMSRRWLGMDITGTLTEYRTTPWVKNAIQKYLDSGATPEFTIQGVQDDHNSDYYDNYGEVTVTLVGCVPTGDLSLINFDAEGELLQDEIEFGANDILFN